MAAAYWKETVPKAVEPETWKGGDSPNLTIAQILAPVSVDTMATTWTNPTIDDSAFTETDE